MEPVTTRLKRLRESAEPAITIRAIAEKLGMPYSTYAAYEDPGKYKKPILPFDFTQKVAAILGTMGVDPLDVMELAGLQRHFLSTLPIASAPKERLQVVGAVAAGRWLEQTDWPEEERYYIEVGPNPFPGNERFAVRMEGLSMDKTIPPGSDLECLRVGFENVVEPRPGDLVIVERHNHNLTEMTCKRLDVGEDGFVLRCESTQPDFQEVIAIGSPDADDHTDNQIRIIGVVIAAQQNHLRRN